MSKLDKQIFFTKFFSQFVAYFSSVLISIIFVLLFTRNLKKYADETSAEVFDLKSAQKGEQELIQKYREEITLAKSILENSEKLTHLSYSLDRKDYDWDRKGKKVSNLFSTLRSSLNVQADKHKFFSANNDSLNDLNVQLRGFVDFFEKALNQIESNFSNLNKTIEDLSLDVFNVEVSSKARSTKFKNIKMRMKTLSSSIKDTRELFHKISDYYLDFREQYNKKLENHNDDFKTHIHDIEFLNRELIKLLGSLEEDFDTIIYGVKQEEKSLIQLHEFNQKLTFNMTELNKNQKKVISILDIKSATFKKAA